MDSEPSILRVKSEESEEPVEVLLKEEAILKKNNEIARENRALLDEHGILAFDVLGAIGSGKTTIIELLVERLQPKRRVAVIAGDVTSTIDADRVRTRGAVTVQVNTGKECHLDANLVHKALRKLNLEDVDLIFIENVGNLICPAEFDLGAHKRMVVVSVTEGEYMIVKHPFIFQASDVAVINKVDLAEAMGVNPDKLVKEAKQINPKIKAIKTCARTGDGINELMEALALG